MNYFIRLMFVFFFIFIFTTGCNNTGKSKTSDASFDDTKNPLINKNDGLIPDNHLNNSVITGDWFRCLDSFCKNIDKIGWRFTAEGKSVNIYPVGNNGAQYCQPESPWLIDSYSWNDQTNKVTVIHQKFDTNTVGVASKDKIVSEPTTYHWKINKNLAEVTVFDKTWTFIRQKTPFITISCKENLQWICPKTLDDLNSSNHDGTRNSCIVGFACDNGFFNLSCGLSTNGKYLCSCYDDENIEKTVYIDSACNGTLDEIVTKMNTFCGFQIYTF